MPVARSTSPARANVAAWLRKAALHALLRRRRKRRLHVVTETDTGREEPIDVACPPDLGAALDREAVRAAVRAEIDEADETTRVLMQHHTDDRPHSELAAQLGLPTPNASMIQLHRKKRLLERSARLVAAYRTWQGADGGHYGKSAPGPERIRVAVARSDAPAAPLELAVRDLRWHPDGFLRGTFVAPADAALSDATPALAMLRGRPGQDDVFAAAEPFTLLWSDGPDGRTANFAAYLGPRPWARPVPFDLPADAVQFLFAV